jgi:hypothetical protein
MNPGTFISHAGICVDSDNKKEAIPAIKKNMDIGRRDRLTMRLLSCLYQIL